MASKKKSDEKKPVSKWPGYAEVELESDEEFHTSKPDKKVLPARLSVAHVADNVYRALAGRKVGKIKRPFEPVVRDEAEFNVLEDDEYYDDTGGGAHKAKKKAKRSMAYKGRAAEGEKHISERLHAGAKVLQAAAAQPADNERFLACIQAALKLSVVPSQVPCRGAQEEEVRSRLLRRIRANASEMVYISGQPGTGKTLTVHRVMETLIAMRNAQKLPDFKFVAINALNDLESPQALFQHLHASLTQGETLSCDKAARELTSRYFNGTKMSPIYLVLLVDELDSLLGKGERGQKVLHTLAEWVSRQESRLLLVGIANTMDLSERLQQRTQSRLAVMPIVFKPYSDLNILEASHVFNRSSVNHLMVMPTQILVSRLRSAVKTDRDEKGADDNGGAADGQPIAAPPLFTLEALMLCAKKTANVSGDIRRALHVCQMAVDRMRPQLLEGTVTSIGIGDVSACLRELRSTPFASLVQNASLYEKLFLIAVAKEMAATGTSETTFDAVCNRLSTMIPLIAPAFRDPGPSVWESVCNALTGSRLLVTPNYAQRRHRVLSVGIEEPDDILFHLKQFIETDAVIKQLFPQ